MIVKNGNKFLNIFGSLFENLKLKSVFENLLKSSKFDRIAV
jgi:hypothetical protein